MSEILTGDGRQHVKSEFMRESLVSTALNENTEGRREVRRMVPDVNFVAIGGRSIFDRGADALLPMVDEIVKQNADHKMVLGVGGGIRIRHTYAIGMDLGLPVGGLARIMGGVEEQNRDMLQFLLSPHGGITFIKDHFQDLQLFLKGGMIPVCIGQPPYHIWEPPVEGGKLPENGPDVGLYVMAEMIGAKSMIFVKDVDGIFDKDPSKHDDAKLIKKATVDELLAMDLPDLPIEPEMLNTLKNSKLVKEIRVVNGLKPETLGQALNGEDVGTLITAK